MAKIKLKIVTPERVVYESDVDQVTLPTSSGQITVLPNHVPLVSVLVAGELLIKNNDQQNSLAVSTGFIQVSKSEVKVVTESAESAEEIDEAKALAAQQKAKELLAQAVNRENVDYTYLAAKIEKELARLKVARKRRGSTIINQINKND